MSEEQKPGRQQELARQLNEEIARDVAHRRLWSGLLTVCLVAVGVLLFTFRLYVFAFAAGGLALVFGILCWDAHGHLHEVRSRPARSLAPRLSELFGKRKTTSQTQDVPQAPT